ncbi:MAG: right-handed parallel beta-helix repeat-containing protein, partial [Desulfobacterales bacterium]|nr:right-handed parallel beta-helix repeat-containing protein [Desulfobacterales bacterium]
MIKNKKIVLKSLIFVLLFFANCFGETQLTGIISQNTTWTLSGSPYIVSGSVTIQHNEIGQIATLTIEPGVEVRFNQVARLNIGGNSGGSGALIAQGTQENPIIFTSNKPTPSKGDWEGITFYNTSDDSSSIIEHCIIEYCRSYGIYINNASPTIRDSIIKNISNYGININAGSPIISGNEITNCTSYGIYVSNSSAPQSISSNVFNENGNYDIY